MLEEIKALICEFVEADADEITEKTDIRNDLGMNSFDVINFAVSLESAYGVDLSDRQLAACFTVGDVIKVIEEKTAEK
ncbi:MAG: acyl carrier protein [Clostridia bacterium]|nr:acyl carrier protein [Clostridia bacterium]